MSTRWVSGLLLVLLIAFQAQLWIGRGSVSHVNQLQTRLDGLNEKNKEARRVNDQLAAEVRDLREGLEMVEEKARAELGMIKPNEILVRYAK